MSYPNSVHQVHPISADSIQKTTPINLPHQGIAGQYTISSNTRQNSIHQS